MKRFNNYHNPALAIVILMLFLLSAVDRVFAQPTFVGEAGSPADNTSSTTATVTITPPAALQAQDLVVVFAHCRATVTLNINNAGGQIWNTAVASSSGSESNAIFWCVYNGAWTANPIFGGGSAGSPMTAVMYAFRPTAAGNSWVVNAGPTAGGPTTASTISLTGLSTAVSNTVTMAFWGDQAATTWGTLTGAGWSKTGLSNQFRNTGGSGQSISAAYDILAAAGTVQNVSQTQSASTNTRTSIITFAQAAAPSNDLCSSPVSLTPSPSCVTTAGSITNANYTAVTGGCGALRADVWYSFTAQTTSPTITVGTLANARFQVFSGSCASLTSVLCSASNSQAVAGLTIGTSYLVRVYSTSVNTGAFTICVADPAPANDLCASATTLTASTTCVNTAGNYYAATTSPGAPTISGSCAGAVTADLWYKFVAPSASPVITLSGIGSNVTGKSGIELLTGDCTNMFSLSCGTTSISAAGLTAGTTYYIRAYYTGTALTTSTNADFNICVTYTAPAAPTNDDCAGAINLPVGATCTYTYGTVNSATASAGIPTGCASTPIAYDVWYKFTAVNTGVSNTITLGGFGTGFGGTQRMQLFSGSCGVLTSMACGTTSITTIALTAGSTYYIRVYTTTGPAPTAFGDFKICISTTSAPPRIGNSYVNITRNTAGGVVQPGDVLEIRMTVLVNSGTIYSTRYLDNVPSKTSMLSSTSDSIRVITNEGLTYKRYTPLDATNDDPATYKSSPGAGEYNIRVNLGHTAGNWPSAPANNTATDITGAGNLPSTANPRGGGGLMFATSFRVTVTGSVGDTITLNGGQFIYRASLGGADVVLSGIPYQILITNPLTLCANAIGVNNASEYGGTFGSGATLNRPQDLSFPIAGYSFVAASSTQSVGDGQYAIVNNTSPISGTNQNAYRKPTCPAGVAPDLLCTNRMFGGYWYIKGDHSGTNNSAGNAPAASNSTGGYMLAVNADYVASEAYRQTLTGLCPNTYYEFSAWLQNICPLCGIDSTGQQFAGTATAPANGYPGVYPNLTFNLDGLDRYSTGQIDTVGWLKKGFVFLTGATQTTATLSIRNNAQGGGGNDWVLDDINIATCFPSMSYSPTATPSVCSGNTIQIGDTVRSQFSNYTYYVWQRSQDGGATWTDLTTPQTASPGLVGSQYQYITNYDVPPAFTTSADSGDIYRVYTATTIPNITNPNCVANDGSAPISLSVLNCGIALKTDLLSFGGTLTNGYGNLTWSTSKELGKFHFELERSDDNVNYTRIYSVDNRNDGNATNYYLFTDPQLITGKKWYRLALVNEQNARKYSNVIQLNVNPLDFEIDNLINPFKEKLSFNITLKKADKIDVELMDMQGKIVKSASFIITPGTNSLQILNTDYLSPGIYTLRIHNSERVINKKVMKHN